VVDGKELKPLEKGNYYDSVCCYDSPSDNIRPATKADFDKFCVFSKGYLGY
jgi:hypothetical protein